MTFLQKLSLLLLPSILFFSSAGFSQTEPPPIPTKPPFTTDATSSKGDGSSLMGMYDAEQKTQTVPMDSPHRTSEQIATWVEDHITDNMNIDLTRWDQHLEKIRGDFDATGLQEYTNYLTANGILNTLKQSQLKMNAIADGNSALLSEGALNGTYHWLYQLPVMLTYYDQATKTFKAGQVNSKNDKVMVRVQIGRVVKGNDDNNIVIEHWTVLPNR